MATEFVSFVETTYSGGSNTWNKTKTLSSLQVKLQATCHVLNELNAGLINLSADDDSKIREDCKSLIDKFFALIDVAKQDKDLYKDSWVHMPKSSTKYQNYSAFRLSYEAQGNYFAGKFYSLVDKSEDSGNIALKYFKKSEIIYKLVAPNMGHGLKRDIAEIQARLNGVRYDNSHASLKEAKHAYEEAIQLSKDKAHSDKIGKVSEILFTVGLGLNYVDTLVAQFHIVEAERLAKELELKCCRVLGPEHHHTIRAVETLVHCKKRYINLLHKDGEKGFFIALNYESGGGRDCTYKHMDTTTQVVTIQTGQYSGEIYLVTGPIADRAEMKGEQELYVASDIVFPCPGCPVICHGLTAATHLNGKLATLRTDSKYYAELARGRKEFGEKDIRCTVYFDDATLKSASVKLKNLQIVFDLDQV
jgi:hypothetical protein